MLAVQAPDNLLQLYSLDAPIDGNSAVQIVLDLLKRRQVHMLTQ